MHKKVFLLILCGFFAFATQSFALNAKGTIRHVYSLLKGYDEKAPNAKAMKKEINQYFLLTYMAKKAIRNHWNTMNTAQRAEYMKLMYRLLEKVVYQDTQENLRKGKVTFKSRQRYNRVYTSIYIKDEDMTIDNDFKVRRYGSIWKVLDIFIDGASMTEDYRSQFNNIISKYGIDKDEKSLFPRLRKAVKEDKDEWRKNWKSKKRKRKKKKGSTPTFLNE